MADAKGRLAHLARPGAEFSVRVTPGAQDARVEEAAGEIRIRVGAPPEGGKANAAAQEALAHALGVAKGRLTLVRGVRARSKLFRLD